MAKKNRTGHTVSVPAPEPAPSAPTLPPQGPAELLVRLGKDPTSGESRLLLTLPGGRESSIPTDPNSMHALVSVLERLAQPPSAAQRTAAAHAQATVQWPHGTPIRFTPPQPSAWRAAPWWPDPSADFCPMTVQAQRNSVEAHIQPDMLRAEAPNGQTYMVPTRWCIPASANYTQRTLKRKASPSLTLADLGFAVPAQA